PSRHRPSAAHSSAAGHSLFLAHVASPISWHTWLASPAETQRSPLGQSLDVTHAAWHSPKMQASGVLQSLATEHDAPNDACVRPHAPPNPRAAPTANHAADLRARTTHVVFHTKKPLTRIDAPPSGSRSPLLTQGAAARTRRPEGTRTPRRSRSSPPPGCAT